jgi:hypothetical protein
MSSFAANQSKTEPHPPGAGDGQTETPGSADPQAPTTAGSAPSTGGLDGDAAPGSSEELPVVQGLHTPDLPETDPRT